MTLSPSGDYPAALRDNLIAALTAAINAAQTCAPVTNTEACYTPAMVYCPSKCILWLIRKLCRLAADAFLSDPETTTIECTVPQFWGVTYQPPNLGVAAPPFIALSLNMVVDTSDFCTTFATIGGAIAGEFFKTCLIVFHRLTFAI